MKFNLILTTCVSFFLFSANSFSQKNSEIQSDSLKYLKLVLDDGSKLSGVASSMDTDEIYLIKGSDTIKLLMENIKSIDIVKADQTYERKIGNVDLSKEKLYYYSRNGFDNESTVFRTNLLLQNSIAFKSNEKISITLGTIIHPRGIELNGLAQFNYGKHKFLHPYSSLGTTLRYGFLANNYLDLRQGFSLGNTEYYLNIELGVNYSLNTSSIEGLNYRLGFFYKVGKNLYLFMEHQKSAIALIKHFNCAGVHFKLKSLNGQIGIQNIYTKNNLQENSPVQGSLNGPLVRLIKPLGS